MRRGPVSPNHVLEKRGEKVWVLGKGCGRLASASKLNLGQVGSSGGAPGGRVLPIPPFNHKIGAIPPFDHFPLINHGETCGNARPVPMQQSR